MKNKLINTILTLVLLISIVLAINQVKAAGNLTITSTGLNTTIVFLGYVYNGEMKNTGDTPITNISVTMQGLDPSNSVVNSSTALYLPISITTSNPLVLMPGQSASFTGIIDGANINHCTGTATYTTASSLPQSLKITVTQASSHNDGTGTVDGSITNTGTANADDVVVYSFFYDASGKLIGSGDDSNIGTLTTGETKTYSASTAGGATSTGAASYKVFAESFTGNGIDITEVAQYVSPVVTNSVGTTSQGTSAPTSPTPTNTVPELPFTAILLLLATASIAAPLIRKKHI